MRIGQSTDIHQLVEGRPCILGGVNVPSDRGLLGHSDADVLLHVVAEAILGALGLGDLGTHFADTDAKNLAMSSSVIVKYAVLEMQKKGYRVANIDTLIMAQVPRLEPYKQQMTQNIAALLEVDVEQVNVKATTGEKLGFVGRSEGIMAQAVVLLLTI
ncbi:MAG: 2-C-methyl-D-erythritol 2,4-cyclodiphosphate synthase [Culicoidibacterales bacterium]